MHTSVKHTCRALAELLVAHGIHDVVMCPGSRNAPLIVAFTRHEGLRCRVVIDERSAAFIALGMASVSGLPVAIVCTSGSAVLNFAPAVSEAYYRRVPLIVVSADRPAEWIDQDDSQTIRQIGILSNIVKQSYNLPVETGDEIQAWYVNRTINDALLTSKQTPPGPVHINVQLDVPLGATAEFAAGMERRIDVVRPQGLLSTAEARSLGSELASPLKVMIIAGFMAPSQKVSRAMGRLSRMPNIAVLTEAQSNLHGRADEFVCNIDGTLSVMTDDEKQDLAPDVVITFGGSLVSRFVKSYLRRVAGLRHWHIGTQSYSVDCFKALDRRIEMEPEQFLPQLASAMQPHRASSDYGARWRDFSRKAYALTSKYLSEIGWSDFTAMATLIKAVPPKANLQLSNGTAVRYAQLFAYGHIHRIDCNRGVSGIDGCTSTAIGASLAYGGDTWLITGDMSAQYDVGALASALITPRLKMVVLNNGGGGIFRFIESTSSLPELEPCFACEVRLPLRQLAAGYGMDYFEAADVRQLEEVLPRFASVDSKPAVLNVITPPQESAKILRSYFCYLAGK